MDQKIQKIGLVGLGLMGQGIAACLVACGFDVTAWSRSTSREEESLRHIDLSLKKMAENQLADTSLTRSWETRFRYTNSLDDLASSDFVIETVGEDMDLKREIYNKLEKILGEEVVIATNTSGISITELQKEMVRKERFIGMHWAEPAEITTYLEIAPGKDTGKKTVERTIETGKQCGKEPTVLNFEVPGLISNRLMYAMMREAISLVEKGVADIETVDRSFRNDIGWWATLFGPFRWMDLTGLKTYAKVMEGLFPDLCNNTRLPRLMQEKVESDTLFYEYDEESMKKWNEAWKEFTYQIRKISGTFRDLEK